MRNTFIAIVIFAIVTEAIATKSSAPPFKRSRRNVETCGERKINVGLISRGVNFPRGAFPWTVALMYTGSTPPKFFCGATLISETFVITAAHCILQKNKTEKFLPRDILATFGANDLSNSFESGRYSLSPKRIFIHDDWNPSAVEYDADIALLEFEVDAISFNNYIQPICLWDNENDPSVTEGTVTGWGKSEDWTKIHENIAKLIKVPIQNNDKCLPGHGPLAAIASERTFCAGLRNGSGVCSGDSGGGLFIFVDGLYHLKGIISSSLVYTGGCDVSNDAIYTNIPKFKDWIQSVTRDVLLSSKQEDRGLILVDSTTLLKKLKTPLLPNSSDCGIALEKSEFRDSKYKFPWVVLLQYIQASCRLYCKGSLINNRYVLTAAHCLEKEEFGCSLSEVRIEALSYEECKNGNRNMCRQDIEIEKKIVHDKYSAGYRYSAYDIALLRLKREVEINDLVKPVCLPSAEYLWNKDYRGENFTITHPETSSEFHTSITFVPHAECRQHYKRYRALITHTQICATDKISHYSCSGDSGSPLMFKDAGNELKPYYIVGVSSFGSAPCGFMNPPEVYIKVVHFLQWIVDNIQS